MTVHFYGTGRRSVDFLCARVLLFIIIMVIILFKRVKKGYFTRRKAKKSHPESGTGFRNKTSAQWAVVGAAGGCLAPKIRIP